MKYKVSVVKTIALLMMTMGLAVAMVACEAATGAPGEQGEPGAPGDQGPAGPAGTTDNEPPMVTAPLPMVYLAMAGTGVMKTSDADDLSEHFSDTENPSLDYKFETTDKDVATAELDDDGKMIVKAKGVGSARITVMVYDGVNDPISEDFDVMVVASNDKPYVDLHASFHTAAADTDSSLEVLRKKLFITNPRGKTKISATIHAGNDPFSDDVDFSFAMGKAEEDDNVVKVDIMKKAGEVDKWEIELTPLKAGIQNVYVTVTDKFGAASETPKNLDEDEDGVADTSADSQNDAPDGDPAHRGGQMFGFVAFVNSVPELDKALPDKTILTSDTVDATDYYIKISEHFDTDEENAAKGPKIGDMAVQAPAPGDALYGADPAADSTAQQFVGLLTANAVDNDTSCTVSTSDKGVVEVSGSTTFAATAVDSVTIAATADDVFIRGRKAGKAIVTVTCRDDEDSDTGTATITVREPRS